MIYALVLPVVVGLVFSFGCATKIHKETIPAGESYLKGDLLIHDSFENKTYTNWILETEEPIKLQNILKDGFMELNVLKGITVWNTQKLTGNIMIEFEATVVGKDGPHDRVSDLNCFWMATDPGKPEDFFVRSNWRQGIFWHYYTLNLYYVGLGGHNNTKTRLRKYHGSADPRPEVIKEYTDPGNLIEANKKCKIKIICFNGLVQYFYNGQKLFELQEEKPYTEGYFGFRTVNNHMIIHDFKVHALKYK